MSLNGAHRDVSLCSEGVPKGDLRRVLFIRVDLGCTSTPPTENWDCDLIVHGL